MRVSRAVEGFTVHGAPPLHCDISRLDESERAPWKPLRPLSGHPCLERVCVSLIISREHSSLLEPRQRTTTWYSFGVVDRIEPSTRWLI